MSPTPQIHRKIKKKKNKKKPKLPKSVSHDSDSDSDPNTQIQTLLELFSKDQLIALAIDLSSSSDYLLPLVKSAADRDIRRRKIFVRGLGPDATRRSVESAMAPYGEIHDLIVAIDRPTGKCKGYAFVTFKSRISAQNLLRNPRVRVGERLAFCHLSLEDPASAKIGSQIRFRERMIYVCNVPLNASPAELRGFFEKFGDIETGPNGLDPVTGRLKGYAIFLYKCVEGAKKALEEPRMVFEGRQLYCRLANEGEE